MTILELSKTLADAIIEFAKNTGHILGNDPTAPTKDYYWLGTRSDIPFNDLVESAFDTLETIEQQQFNAVVEDWEEHWWQEYYKQCEEEDREYQRLVEKYGISTAIDEDYLPF